MGLNTSVGKIEATVGPLMAWIGFFFLSGISVAMALEPPHDSSNNIDCLNCHALHSSTIVPRGEEQAIMCAVCHNPTGQASGKSDVALHVVRDGSITVDCGSCHDAHSSDTATDPHTGVSAPNLTNIRTNTTKYIPQALEPAIFQIKPDDFSFAVAPYNGICQTCHTDTTHHSNTGVDPYHLENAVCTTCHSHESGFAPGGCTQCHSEAQGSRRIIVGATGDFGRSSHHVRGEVQDADCQTCHHIREHGGGTVKLRDADLGSDLVYDYDPANPEGMEDFCLSCHDGDGALANEVPEPFSDGVMPPDIEGSGFWANSAHNLIGYPDNSGNPITCMGDGSTSGCHGNAHGSDNDKILNVAAGIPMDQFCFGCHTDGKIVNDALSNNRPGGYVSADDIEEAFGKSEKHNVGVSFTMNGSTFTLQCTSCHNPHLATGTYWDARSNVTATTRPDFSDPVNNPRAMGTELWGDEAGEKTSDFAARSSGSGGWYFSQARGGYISLDQPAIYQPPKSGSGYEFEFDGDVLPDYTTLCLDCHSERMSDANPPVNWGQGIGCTGNSVDPPDQRVECGGDHGLGRAGKPYYVSDSGTGGAWGASGNPDVLFDMNYVTRGRHNGHFMRWPYDSANRSSGINFVLACTDCHEAHGSNRGSMIRERFNVNSNGDCGTGGNSGTLGENCSDGGNWNSFCNACHYFYGGQHSGMSCGNASCHEANSIHRIIHTTDSGAGSQLMVTAAGYEDYYVPPDFTPEIIAVEGLVGDSVITVTFATGVFAESDLTGNLTVDDFWLFDTGNDNPRTILNIAHAAGDATATITMSAPLILEDLYNDVLATTGASVWAWYDGGYQNWATGTIAAQAVSAGPWPATFASPCPTGSTAFMLDELPGSFYTMDDQGALLGTVANPAFVFQNGDGYFHGDETQGTYIDFDKNGTCLKTARALTLEARVRPDVVDLDYNDADGDGIDDDDDPDEPDLRNSTQQRIFERKQTIQFTIMRGNWAGDGVIARAGKARVKVKYYVDVASRHTCPHSYWPDDPYVGNDSRWHEVNSDIDLYPIVASHWYQIRIVFNSDNTGTPPEIFADDQGTDGNGTGELWAGYIDIMSHSTGSCQYGALPGDYMATDDQFTYIGDNSNHTDVPGEANNQLFKGLIDWVSWRAVVDYSGLDGI